MRSIGSFFLLLPAISVLAGILAIDPCPRLGAAEGPAKSRFHTQTFAFRDDSFVPSNDDITPLTLSRKELEGPYYPLDNP